jgi:hypothetical protein
MSTSTAIEMGIEHDLLKYFQLKEIIKERQEEVKLLQEKIEQYYEEHGREKVVAQLENGEFGILDTKHTIKEVLDKDALAQELQIAKDELKTPFDFSMLTKQEKLTPQLISKHTETQVVEKIKISKSKRKPKEQK